MCLLHREIYKSPTLLPFIPIMWRLIVIVAAVAWGQVVFVAEMCRHGSRAPITLYPWDEDGRWSNGAGELSYVGMRQHFLLGSELRQRYIVEDPVLSPSYTATQVYFRSTDVNRTLMSAQSQLMGLYPQGTGPKLPLEEAFTAVPPITVENENEIISFLDSKALIYQSQAVPIHTLPGSEDLVLQAGDSCQLLSENIDALEHTAQYIQTATSNPAVIQTIQTLLNTTTMGAVHQLSSVVDDLICNQFVGNELPEEATESFMQGARTVFNQLFALPYQTDQNARLFSSGFFLELAEVLQAVSEGTEKNKFRLYSAHDTTIAGILAGLQAYNNQQPPFASTLIFEAYVQNYAMYVDVKYNDQTLSLPGCPSPCSISAFITFLQQRAYPNLEEVCEGSGIRGFLS